MSSSGIRVSGGTRVHFVSQWEHFNSWSYSLLSAFGIKSIQSGKRTMANPVIILATAAIVCTVLAPANSELCINTPKCHDVITHKDMCDSTAQLSFVKEHCAKFCGLCNYSRLDGGETNKLPVSPTSICDDTAEVVFVLDGSSSVGKANFEKVRKFTQDVTREMKLEYQKLNVTVITFSNEAQVTLQLNESVDISTMVAQEANITYTHGGTETHKALNLMYQSYHHNVNSSKIAIVITDGASFEPALTRQAAENAKKNGVTIFVIAVGDDVNPHETQGISSDPDERYLKFLQRFSDLQQIVGFFHTRNCTTTTTTTITTTTTPTTTTTTEAITTKQKTTTTTVPQTEATSKPTTVTSATVTNRPSLITGQSPSAKPVSVIGLSPSAKPPFIAQSTESGNTKTPGFVSGRSPSAAPYTNTGVPPSLVPPIGFTAKTQKPIVQTGETVGIQTKPFTKPTTTTTMETPAPTTPTTTTQPTTKSTTTTTEATPAPTTPTTTTTQPTTKSTTTLATTKPTTKSTTTTTEATPAPTTPTTTTTQPTTKSTTTMATTKPTTKSTTTTTEATPAPTTPTTTTTQPTIKSTTTLATTKPTTKLTTTTTEATPAPTTPTTTTTQPTTKSTTTVATTKPTTKSTTTTTEATPAPTTPTTTTTQPTTKSTTLMATTKPTSKSATTTTEATPAPTKPTTTTTQPTTKSTNPVVTSKPTTKASSPTTTTTVLTTQPTPIPTTTTQPTVKSTTSTTQSTKASTKATSPVQLAHSSPTTTTQQPSTTTTEPPVTTSTVPPTTTTAFTSSTISPTTTTASCIAKIADVVFVVDTSGSIGLANFEKVKRFIKEVVMTFDIDSRYTRVALIEYSSDARIEFKLNEKTNLTDLLDAIDNVTYSGGGTSTSDALQLMRQEGFERERPAAPDIAVIITDGLSKFPSLTRAQANLAKKDGITMFSIGIGNLTASSELFAMATNRHYVFEVGDYETLLLLDNVVAHRACGIVLPEEYHSRSTTPLTTTQKGCRDLDANCVNYPRDSCTDYAPYARKNCARKCGYCPEYPLVEPLCEDKEPNCASYGTQICFSSSQYDWVDEHCRKFCSFCGNKTEIEETTTTTPTTPAVSTAPSCVDVDTRCDKYGGPSMCTQPSYETWAKYNCKKYCGYCYSYHTVTSATVLRVRCPAWTLPEQCVLEYSGGQCCPYPKCPDGFKLTIKRKLK